MNDYLFGFLFGWEYGEWIWFSFLTSIVMLIVNMGYISETQRSSHLFTKWIIWIVSTILFWGWFKFAPWTIMEGGSSATPILVGITFGFFHCLIGGLNICSSLERHAQYKKVKRKEELKQEQIKNNLFDSIFK